MVQEAIRRGELELAHRLCLELTEIEPANERAWALLAEAANDLPEKVAALGRLAQLNPRDGAARQQLYAAMHALLREDAFLAYRGETRTFYEIETCDGLGFTHPKNRALVPPYPSHDISPAHKAQRWLAWSALGLIPAGLGAVLLAPIAIAAGLRALAQPVSPSERRRAWIIIAAATGLWGIAVALIFLFVLHLR